MDTKIICGHDNFVVTLTNKWCFRPYFILNDLMAKFYCDPFWNPQKPIWMLVFATSGTLGVSDMCLVNEVLHFSSYTNTLFSAQLNFGMNLNVWSWKKT